MLLKLSALSICKWEESLHISGFYSLSSGWWAQMEKLIITAGWSCMRCWQCLRHLTEHSKNTILGLNEDRAFLQVDFHLITYIGHYISLKSINDFLFYLCTYVYVCGYVHINAGSQEGQMVWIPLDELDTPRSRVPGSCEPPDVGARNQILLLHESNIYF